MDVEEFVAWMTSYSQRVLDQQVNREEAIRTGEQLHRGVSEMLSLSLPLSLESALRPKLSVYFRVRE
jgi:hypothetical protein